MTGHRFIVAVFLSLTACFASADPAEDFAALLGEAWEWQLDEYPVRASMLGDRRANDRWGDNSLQAIERRYQEQRTFLTRLQTIDASELNEQDQLNYDLFRRQLQNDIDANKYRAFLMPINQRGGVQSIESTAENLPMSSVQDYEDWLARMASVDDVIEQTMALQEAGRKQGFMPPKILMQRIPNQIAAQLVENAKDSPFYLAFKKLPDSFSDEDKKRIRQSARNIIDKKIVRE